MQPGRGKGNDRNEDRDGVICRIQHLCVQLLQMLLELLDSVVASPEEVEYLLTGLAKILAYLSLKFRRKVGCIVVTLYSYSQ